MPRAVARAFAGSWDVYAYDQQHNAVFALGARAAPALRRGVSWRYAEKPSLPLDGPPIDQTQLGYLAAQVKTTQMLGNAVGVTAVGGRIYAESDSNYVYALNALTGHLIWRSPTVNAAMGNPVVADGLVFVGAGDTGFSFANVLRYASGQPVVRGMGFAAVYAFSARTGRLVWRYDTKGEDMPSVVYVDGRIYFGNGDGHVYALDARTGRPVWIAHVGGFDSMSSANFWRDPATGETLILVGFSDPNYLYALNASTGAVVWKVTIPGVFNTGMGDNSPAVDPQHGIVFQDSVINFDKANKTSDLGLFAVDAKTGQVLWETDLGRGASPPAYKAAIAMVAGGVVYVGNPANGYLTAVNELTGKKLWATDLGSYMWQGVTYHIQNRGGPALYRGVLYQAAGPFIFALDPTTGRILGKHYTGGRYGIVNPVIVGGTMYLDNSYDWVFAIPLSRIYAHWRTGP